MKQYSSNDNSFKVIQRTTKREAFLNAMDSIIPWDDWVRMIKPHYYKGLRGRPPIGIEPMLRMYLLQSWFNLSDEYIEDAIIDIKSMQKFVGMDFEKHRVPDATTLCNFRDILKEHKIGEKIFQDVVRRLEAAGLMMHGGTIVDATIIHAPSSTKNKEGKRDP